ncbi:MAG: hypothetical protein V3V10_09810 [Planctomycetota bacterium]
MRQIFIAIIIVVSAAGLGLHLSAPTLNAEQILERSLHMLPASTELGNFVWLEDHGIGIELDAAPAPDGPFPHLLAGKNGSGKASFWELGPQGISRFQQLMESCGGQLSKTLATTLHPQNGLAELAASRTLIRFDDGQMGCVFDFKVGKRHYALLKTENSGYQDEAVEAAIDLISNAVILPASGSTGTHPILNEGRYAASLPGWKRNGQRYFKESNSGWMALRIFQISIDSYPAIKQLQAGVESRLNAQGYKRSGGVMPQIAGNRGFIGEYYKDDGDTVERLVFAQLESAWLLGLYKSSVADRSELEIEASNFANSIVQIDLNQPRAGGGMYYGRVRSINLIVWKDGQRIMWGALFDDSQQRPVLWRQEGVEWQLTYADSGRSLGSKKGIFDSSRDLNPLVNTSVRALNLPDGFKGNIELALAIKGVKSTARLNIE